MKILEDDDTIKRLAAENQFLIRENIAQRARITELEHEVELADGRGFSRGFEEGVAEP